FATLTPREREVLDLVITGLPNKNIATALGTTEKTIKAHRARIMQKMRPPSLATLVRMAAFLGLGGPDGVTGGCHPVVRADAGEAGARDGAQLCCRSRRVWLSVRSCQVLAHHTHPYTSPAKGRKALLERLCQGRQRSAVHPAPPPLPPPEAP